MKTKIKAKSHGINWMHYAEFEVDSNQNTAKKVNSFRLHKWDDFQGSAKNDYSLPDFEVYSGWDMKKWLDDGKPGGIQGMKENYSKKPQIKIGEDVYDLI